MNNMYGKIDDKYLDVKILQGRTIDDIEVRGDDELIFSMLDGDVYIMHHRQDCCERVVIEEVIGELSDLIGSPITMAEAVTQISEDNFGSETWTFYKFATIKGYVTLRWLGKSNGYYSERVDFNQIHEYKN